MNIQRVLIKTEVPEGYMSEVEAILEETRKEYPHAQITLSQQKPDGLVPSTVLVDFIINIVAGLSLLAAERIAQSIKRRLEKRRMESEIELS